LVGEPGDSRWRKDSGDEMKKRFLVKTLGCKANSSDGQQIESGLLRHGWSPATGDADADVIVVNSCTVTDEADRQSRKLVRDLARKNPAVRVIYTGCGAEVDPESALKIPGVSAVVGNQDKDRAADWIVRHLEVNPSEPEILGSVRGYEEFRSRHPIDREWAMPSTGAEELLSLDPTASTFRTRAFIKIQEGCNAFCTYCVIPYGRGPARSLSIENIVEQVSLLKQEGIREVILTGTNIGDYGIDWSDRPRVDDLIESILTRSGIERLRVGSLDPTEISERMVGLMEDHEAFCPHFHVSVQHTESRILKLMKRKYTVSEVESCLERLATMKRRPFVGMDLITGFPGESEEEFTAMENRLQGLYWSRLHVFPYSERSGTPATRLPDPVEFSKRKERARRLLSISLDRMTGRFSEARAGGRDRIDGVLIEGRVKGPDGARTWLSGYSRDYQRVLLPEEALSPEIARNRVVQVRVGRWFIDRASGEVSWIGETHA
jgi:threonylcarbamoyladenosine tRNA methylthiotransferase MtaB